MQWLDRAPVLAARALPVVRAPAESGGRSGARPGANAAAPAPGALDVSWDPAGDRIDAARLEGTDAVVHLAGASIAAGRWTAARKELIRKSRVDATQLLSRALAGPFLQFEAGVAKDHLHVHVAVTRIFQEREPLGVIGDALDERVDLVIRQLLSRLAVGGERARAEADQTQTPAGEPVLIGREYLADRAR